VSAQSGVACYASNAPFATIIGIGLLVECSRLLPIRLTPEATANSTATGPAQIGGKSRRYGIRIAKGFMGSTVTIVVRLRRGYTYQMPKLKSTDVLPCARVDDTPVPTTRSFIVQCVQCGARIWVAYESPIEPVRMCVLCSMAHTAQTKKSGDSIGTNS